MALYIQPATDHYPNVHRLEADQIGEATTVANKTSTTMALFTVRHINYMGEHVDSTHIAGLAGVLRVFADHVEANPQVQLWEGEIA